MISDDCASTSKDSESGESLENLSFDLKTIEPLEKVCWIHEKNRGIVYNPILKKYVLKELPFYEMDSYEENRKFLDELNANLEKPKIDKPAEELVEVPIEKKKEKTVGSSESSFWKKRGGEPVIDAECSMCKLKFTTIRTLLDHRLQAHSEAEMLTCSFCGLQHGKRTHISQHLYLEYQVYKCEKCSKSFRNNHHLTTHRCGPLLRDPNYVARKKKEPKYHCENCSRDFVYQGTFQRHQVNCTEIVNKKFPLYVSSDTLLDHDYIQQPKCKKCKILFQSVGFLNEHCRKVHVAGGFKCPKCFTTYMNRKWFSLHVESCSGGGIKPPFHENDPPEPIIVDDAQFEFDIPMDMPIDDDFYCDDHQPQPRNRTRKLIEEMRGHL